MAATLHEKRIAVIGAGAMGQALIQGLLRTGQPPESLLATRRRPEALAPLAALGIATATDSANAIRTADIVLLAIKPQGWRDTVAELVEAFQPGQLVLSVLAGVPTTALAAALPVGVFVVRAMPNTPALVGQGVTGLCAAGGSEGALDVAELVFAASGRVFRVEERLMDALTVTSGSGPAYLFYLAELMRDGATALGLDRALASELVAHTLRGAADLLVLSGADPTELRAQVTSPGGTTARVIGTLEDSGMRDAFLRGMDAGRRRAAELARG